MEEEIDVVNFDENNDEQHYSGKENSISVANKETRIYANLTIKSAKKRESTEMMNEGKKRSRSNSFTFINYHREENFVQQVRSQQTDNNKPLAKIPSFHGTQKPLANVIENDENAIPECLSPSSSDSSMSDDSANMSKDKRRRKDKRWRKDTTFNVVHKALEVVAKEEIWSIQSRHANELGERVYYRCNRIKSKAKQQCDSGLYLLYHNNSDQVTVFRSLNAHNHEELPGKANSLIRSTVEDAIKNYLDKGLRRKEIMNQLLVDGLPVPSKYQLNNFVAKVRKQRAGTLTIKLNELETLLKDHSDVPDDVNKAFVVAYQVTNDTNIGFTFFISSKKLLTNAIGKELFVADSTAKMMWQGFPVSPIGTVDKNNHFHLIGMGTSSHGMEEDFTFFFQSIKSRVREILQGDVNPSIILCDETKAISNAFLAVFGKNCLVLMCWFHMKKSIEQKIGIHFPKEMHKDVIEDIDYLQLSRNYEIFENASKLFVAKYAPYKEFVSYFEYQCLRLNRNWFEGAAQRTPSSNNALESFYRNFQQKRTLRTRLPLAEFAAKMFAWIESWGKEYDSGVKRPFADTPTVTLEQWTRGYQWACLNEVIKKQLDFRGPYVVIPSEDAPRLQNNQWIDWTSWQSFDEFKSNAFAAWKVYMRADNWLSSTCTCPAFHKQFLCKHLVGLALRLQYTIAPIDAKSIEIGSKRKRGRPSKANAVLLIQ